MYTLKPINDLSQPIVVPDVMYRLKPINDPGEVREKEGKSSLCVESLERRQESILRGLTDIKARLSAHKVSLGLGPIQAGSSNMSSCNMMLNTVQQHQIHVLEKVDQIKSKISAMNHLLSADVSLNDESFTKQDIVVFAHPSHPPYGIFLTFHQLKARGLKIFTSCHAHSSITGSLPENVTDFLPAHQDNLTRSDADLILTIIWKNLGDRDPITVVSPLMKHSSIKGEINILRYICRLYPTIWNYGTHNDPKVEYYLDTIHSDLFWSEGETRKKKEETIFKGLESTFLTNGGSSFLSEGSEPGILDLVAWSIATQDNGKLAVPSTALKKWLTSCNKVCAFYGSRQHRLSSHRHRRTSHGAGNGHNRRRNNSSSKTSHKNNRKKNQAQSLDVENNFAPGSLVSRQWPSIPDIVEGDSSDLFISNLDVVVSEKLDGSNVALSSNGVVSSRRIVLLNNPDRQELRNYVFAGVSLESLWPYLSTIKNSLSLYFKKLLESPSIQITVFGELIQKGTATSKEDKFSYKDRGFLPGTWHAFGLSIANDSGNERSMLNKVKVNGFSARSVQSMDVSGTPRDECHIVIHLNSRLESLFRSSSIPTLETKTLPFNEVFETYGKKLLQPDSCEGLVITVPSNGAVFKWKQLSGGYLIKNGSFFKEKSNDERYSKILQIMRKVAGLDRLEERLEDLLRLAYESARTKYPDVKEKGKEKYSTLITEEILKDLKQEEEINENAVRQFVMRQR